MPLWLVERTHAVLVLPEQTTMNRTIANLLVGASVVACIVLLACGREHYYKSWAVYQSGKYYKITDAKGRLSDEYFTSRETASDALECEIHFYEIDHAKRVWREVK